MQNIMSTSATQGGHNRAKKSHREMCRPLPCETCSTLVTHYGRGPVFFAIHDPVLYNEITYS